MTKLKKQDNLNAHRAALAARKVLDAFGISADGEAERSYSNGKLLIESTTILGIKADESIAVKLLRDGDSVSVLGFRQSDESIEEIYGYKRGLWQFHLQELAKEAAVEIRKREDAEDARKLAEERAEYERQYGPIDDAEEFSGLAARVQTLACVAIQVVREHGELQETLSDFRDYPGETDFEAYADSHLKIWYDPVHNGVDIGIGITEDGSARRHVFGAYDGNHTYPETYVPGEWEDHVLDLYTKTD